MTSRHTKRWFQNLLFRKPIPILDDAKKSTLKFDQNKQVSEEPNSFKTAPTLEASKKKTPLPTARWPVTTKVVEHKATKEVTQICKSNNNKSIFEVDEPTLKLSELSSDITP